MKTMTAKYPGKCVDCGLPFQRGAVIVYHGKGRGCSCAECAEVSAEDLPDEDEAASLEPGTLANDRRMARRGLSVTRFSSGEVMTRNTRGRCEDAPCCGCCS